MVYPITLGQISTDLLETHEITQSWKVAGDKYGLNKATARLIAKGYEPGRKVRKILNLPPAVTVIVIGGGEIPEGAQVISANICECGQWYVSNHPSRTHCFICRPFRRRKYIK